MKLPTTTYEDTVGTRITLINYKHMASLLIEEIGAGELDQIEDMLRWWGDAIYTRGMKHEPPPHLIQPLKAVAS